MWAELSKSPKKVGKSPFFRKKVGRENCEKIDEKWLKTGKNGRILVDFGGFRGFL